MCIRDSSNSNSNSNNTSRNSKTSENTTSSLDVQLGAMEEEANQNRRSTTTTTTTTSGNSNNNSVTTKEVQRIYTAPAIDMIAGTYRSKGKVMIECQLKNNYRMNKQNEQNSHNMFFLLFYSLS